MNTSHLVVDLATTPLCCTAENLKAIFGWLLLEMRSVAKVLRPDEREVLRTIMSHADTTLTVGALFPTFRREGESHKTLRRLRATQFVCPGRTGRWEREEPISVTPFARIVWDQLGEEEIFSPASTELNTATSATRTPPPNQTPVTWDNLLECFRERQRGLPSGTR